MAIALASYFSSVGIIGTKAFIPICFKWFVFWKFSFRRSYALCHASSKINFI